MNEVIKTMKRRRMTRNYKLDQITDDAIMAIIDAGQHAPSVQKQQAWHFTVIQNKTLMDKMNKEAKILGQQSPVDVIRKLNSQEDYHIFYQAPTVILISADSTGFMPEKECIAAGQNMFLAAESLGLGACWISAVGGLFSSEDAQMYRDQLGLAEDLLPQMAIALGYIESRPDHAYPRKTDRTNFVR